MSNLTNNNPSLNKQSEIQDQQKLSDTNARYAAYFRYVTFIKKGIRHLAFASDVGEAFRPVVSPLAVKATYGISWCYVLGDVAYEGHKAKQNGVEGKDLGLVVAERAIFQSLASMVIPMILIHNLVHVTQHQCNKIKKFQKWGPTFAGLSLIPFLPMFLDEPVEHVVEYAFSFLKSDKHVKHQ